MTSLLSRNPIGTMQGRLLPKYLGQYQAHPVGFWQDEFPLAAGLRLDCIEFILDFETAEVNPLLSRSGRESVIRVIHESGVQVLSICADYFMQSPLHLKDNSEAKKSAEVLTQLIETCPDMGIKNIIIPCVDRSSLRGLEQQDLLVESLSKFLDRAKSNNVQLALETDLAPQDFLHLLQKIGDSAISVNYDMGNSASLGFDPATEFGAYGERISNVHVKDRPFRGSSTTLGDGDAQISLVLQLLDGLSYQGPLIMQAFRGDDGYATFGPQYETLLGYLRLTK